MGRRTVHGTLFISFNAFDAFLFLFFWSCLAMTGHAQPSSISTNMPVPPLQWLNITGLTNGASAPPLKDCSMGYDESTRSLVIFGGQSQAGLPQQTTYLLNMDSLTWSIPSSKVPTMTDIPSPRSRALGTGDFAVNSRRNFVIFGGEGAMGQATNDVWAYDFANEFWVNVFTSGNGPSPRWGASGGIDPTDMPNSGNEVSSGFIIVGGSDTESDFPLSEIWELNITGTLASDVDTLHGIWHDLSLSSNVPGRSDSGGALVPKTQARPARIAITGGCGQNSSPLSANLTCVDPNTFVLTANPGSSASIAQCPAPRLGPVLVPNLNTASQSFTSQAFLLLGTFNESIWSDNGGLEKGEVAVLDVDTGVWARILPTGDPNSPNKFPAPRTGAASFAFNTALVGPDRGSSSDIIIFGGQDANGQYLNDLWILRAYNSTINQSGQKWPGFGNGNVQSGVDASGTGVLVNYLSQCANNLSPSSTSTGTTMTPATGGKPHSKGGQTAVPQPKFDTSVVHKALSPISLAIAFVSVILIRLSLPAINTSPSSVENRMGLLYLGIIIGIVAYAVGIVGFVIALTSTKSVASSEGSFLRTPHGRGGFVLFILLYVAIPSLFIFHWFRSKMNRGFLYFYAHDSSNKLSQDNGAVLGEKPLVNETHRSASPAQSAPEIASLESSLPSKRQRTVSGPGLFPRWQDRSSSESSPVAGKGFEVVNRPRRSSTNNRPREIVRSLNDLTWLERRRSVGVVADLDYALTHLGRTSPRSTSPLPSSRPPTISMSNRPFVRTPIMPPTPDSLDSRHVISHTLFHILLLANCVLALVILFSRAPLVSFILFLIWTTFFYICLFYLAWGGRPRSSALTIAFYRLRGQPHLSIDPPPEEPAVDDQTESQIFPNNGSSPYAYHQPSWRRVVTPDDTSHGRPTAESDVDDDDDEDEASRQRRMEDELERRDVHIVTVPRKRLWITNPS